MSIKKAEKKPRLGVVECSVLDICFFIRCWTFDVRCWAFIFQNNFSRCLSVTTQSVYLECLMMEKIAGKTIMEANKQALMPMTATYPMLLSPG